MLSQFPHPSPASIESWLLPAAAIGSMALLAKKLFVKKTPPENLFVTRPQFHLELDTVRDKIDARFLALSEKIGHLANSIHDRLNHLESAVARLDERTKI